MTPPPLVVTAVIGTVLAWRRGDRRFAAVAGVVVAWSALLSALMFTGYPADGRFFIHPTALLTVLGAAGAELMVRAIPGRRRMVLAAALALALTPFLVERSADSVIEAKHALGRARLERDLNSTLIAVKGQMRRCDRPMIPRGLSWLKGAVAWQADLPLRKVRTRGTGAVSFVRSLPDVPGLRLSARDSVTVVPHTVRFLLVVPFGDARIRIAHHPRLRLQTAAAAGQWRALVPASTPGCSVR